MYDGAGRFEQVFIAVREIKDGKIKGVIASDIQLVSGHKKGDSHTFPEGELIDWTISLPDGTEEGNFVGKFLDTYQAQATAQGTALPSVWRNKPATPERMIQRIEEAAGRAQAEGPVPLLVLFDIGYPHDDREYAALDGHAVVLITVLAHDREELPLKRVYVLVDGKETELKRIKEVLSELSATGSVPAKVFGAFRADALFYYQFIYVRRLRI